MMHPMLTATAASTSTIMAPRTRCWRVHSGARHEMTAPTKTITTGTTAAIEGSHRPCPPARRCPPQFRRTRNTTMRSAGVEDPSTPAVTVMVTWPFEVRGWDAWSTMPRTARANPRMYGHAASGFTPDSARDDVPPKTRYTDVRISSPRALRIIANSRGARAASVRVVQRRVVRHQRPFCHWSANRLSASEKPRPTWWASGVVGFRDLYDGPGGQLPHRVVNTDLPASAAAV